MKLVAFEPAVVVITTHFDSVTQSQRGGNINELLAKDARDFVKRNCTGCDLEGAKQTSN